MKTVLSILAIIVAVFVGGFALKSLGMIEAKFFNSWFESNRYEVQKESAAYRDGLQRNLSQLMNDYNAADAAGKAGIIAATKHQYAQVNKEHIDEMPQYLQDFLRTAGIY